MNCKINIQSSVYSTFVLNFHFKFLRYLDLFRDIQGHVTYIHDIQSSVYLLPCPQISLNMSECDEWQEYTFKYSSYFFNI